MVRINAERTLEINYRLAATWGAFNNNFEKLVELW